VIFVVESVIGQAIGIVWLTYPAASGSKPRGRLIEKEKVLGSAMPELAEPGLSSRRRG
jgi:hypothetical protein